MHLPPKCSFFKKSFSAACEKILEKHVNGNLQDLSNNSLLSNGCIFIYSDLTQVV